MTDDERDFNARNWEIIAEFLAEASQSSSDLSNSSVAIIAQFLMNLRSEITKFSRTRHCINTVEIISFQVQELRQCIIDLESYKKRLTEGVKRQ